VNKLYIKRWLADKLSASLNVSSVLVLTGARQTGKTTLLKNEPIFEGFKYFSLDDLDTLAQVQKDPSPIINSGQNIIIDEAQREPKFYTQLKRLLMPSTSQESADSYSRARLTFSF